VKEEEGVVIVYMVKWQCSFKYSWSSYRLVNITASWSCPGSNSGLLGVGRRENIGAAM